MCPRRTLSVTSRTAKNPANSFVNPWVSRMNSSAKQFPPAARSQLAHGARSCPAVLGTALKNRPELPPPGRNMPEQDGVRQGGKLGRRLGRDSPLVERLQADGLRAFDRASCTARPVGKGSLTLF